MKSRNDIQFQWCNFKNNTIDTIDPDQMPSANDMAHYIPQTAAADSEFRTLLIRCLSSLAAVIAVRQKNTRNVVV